MTPRNDAHHGGFVPAFSNELASAWELLETMIGFGWYPRIECHQMPHGRMWRVVFVDALRRHRGTAQAAALPLAICYATLDTMNMLIESDTGSESDMRWPMTKRSDPTGEDDQTFSE